MLQIDFSTQVIERLYFERFNHPHPRVQLKMEAVYLKSQQVSHGEICRLLRISENTLRSYLRDYLEGGLEKLKELNFYAPNSDLEPYRSSIEAYFRENPPATLQQASEKIEQLTGVVRGRTQVGRFLHALGMRRLKVGSVPGKANAEVQQEFKKNSRASP